MKPPAASPLLDEVHGSGHSIRSWIVAFQVPARPRFLRVLLCVNLPERSKRNARVFERSKLMMSVKMMRKFLVPSVICCLLAGRHRPS
jgi:hypothetical protein